MRQKKLIRVLETFNEKEWRACHKYLKFCNKKESKGLQLFEYIFKYRGDWNSSAFDASRVRKKVLKGNSDRAFLNLLSDLVKDIEAFMVHDYMHSSIGKYDHKSTLTKIFKRRGLYKYFERTWKEVNIELEANPKISLFHSLRKLEMNHSMYFSDVYTKNAKPVEFLIEAEKNRKFFSENLRTFYHTEINNLKSLVNIEAKISINSKDNLLSQLLVNLNLLITQRDESSFEYLNNQLHTNYDIISDDLKKGIIIDLINYCIYQIRSGDNSKKEQMAELTLYGLKQGIYLQNNRLSENTFLNIIDSLSNSTLELNREIFITEWIKKVNTKDLLSVKNMAYAMWAFAKGEYSNALERLSTYEIHLNRPNMSLRARRITICSLCSLYQDYEEKDEIIKSSISFFNRIQDKVNLSAYIGSINLVKVVNYLWKDEKSETIHNYIASIEFLAMRTWVDKMLNIKTQKDSLSSGS
ncbi:MAG: hypothetical protein P8M34_02090 [Saprospiraceae bacterium]|nr:hypothetical protein [Saprospiraceae bacterium]